MSSLDAVSPVFIVGSVRSGSTLLHLMLDSHPQIINPGEFDFLFDLLDGNNEYPDMEVYYQWLSLNRIFLSKNLQIDVNLSYLELIYSFLDQLGSSKNTLTLNVHRNFQRIPKIFPDARYIHLIRDPRDVARSCIGMGWAGHVFYGVDIWVEAERSWELLKPTLDRSQYIEVRYEDLIANMELTLSTICEFIGENYSSRMTDYAECSSYGLPDRRLTYQWKRKYSEHELCLVEGKIGKMIFDKGYELSGFPSIIPGKYESYALALRNKLYRIKFSINTYGFFLYIAYFVSVRFGRSSWKEYCLKKINQINVRGLK